MPLNRDLPGIIRVGQGAAISLDVACEDSSWVCVSVSCGGRAGVFPGQLQPWLQPASYGFCACQETREERIGWMRRSLGREAVFAAFPEVIGYADDPPSA